MTTKIEVGKEYVLGWVVGAGLAPCQCNHGSCRVTIVSVGRKYAKAMLSGYSKPTRVGGGLIVNTNESGLWEIEVAKASYRAGLEDRDDRWRAQGETCMLGADRINQLVEGL